jgi:hypothetical protein
VFDEAPGERAPVSSSLSTVRQVGTAWTSGELFKSHGAVNGLRPMSGGSNMAGTLRKNAYTVKTRGPKGPDFGGLLVRDVTRSERSLSWRKRRPRRCGCTRVAETTGAAAEGEGFAANTVKRRECEGGDLNPDALSGASTSS